MKLNNLQNFNHQIINTFVSTNAVVVDATCGNGHDTKYISQINTQGLTYSFDIQSEAIQNTKLLCNELTNIKYIHDSHVNINLHVSDSIDFAIFNLGYLPNSDSNLTTIGSNTIIALSQLLKLLKVGSAISIMIYSGHDDHQEEVIVQEFISTLNKYSYSILKYEFLNLSNSPYLIVIEKKKEIIEK